MQRGGGQRDRSRARREQLKRFLGLLPESQGQNLAVTVLYVPHSLDSGRGETVEFRTSESAIDMPPILARRLIWGFGFRVSSFGFRFRISGFWFRVSGFWLRVSSVGLRASDFGLWVSGFEVRVSGFGFQVSDFRFRVQVVGCKVQSVGCRV